MHEYSKIVAIVDTFDAMTTSRVYHKAIDTFPTLKIMFSLHEEYDKCVLRAFTELMGPAGLGQMKPGYIGGIAARKLRHSALVNNKTKLAFLKSDMSIPKGKMSLYKVKYLPRKLIVIPGKAGMSNHHICILDKSKYLRRSSKSLAKE